MKILPSGAVWIETPEEFYMVFGETIKEHRDQAFHAASLDPCESKGDLDLPDEDK